MSVKNVLLTERLKSHMQKCDQSHIVIKTYNRQC
jgi:hypothetical protein